MRKTLIVLAVLAVLLGGCQGVRLNAEYSQLLDKTAALSAESARRAEANELTTVQMVEVLVKQAETWAMFQAGRDGKATP